LQGCYAQGKESPGYFYLFLFFIRKHHFRTGFAGSTAALARRGIHHSKSSGTEIKEVVALAG
jgi:hypothetical protein